MPKPSSPQPTSTIDEVVLLWLLTNVFGSIISWITLYLWSPFSWGDEEMLAPILIIFLVGIQSLVIIPLAGHFFDKALEIPKVPERLLAVAALCVGLCIADCYGLMVFMNLMHWIALLLSTGSYLIAVLLSSGVVYRHWLLYTDDALPSAASNE